MSQSRGIGTLRFMAPELLVENGDAEKLIHYTNKIDVYSFGITLIYIVTGKYPNFNIKNVVNGINTSLPKTIAKWVHKLINQCLSLDADKRPSFEKIIEIMKANNYDLFKNKTSEQQRQKEIIEKKIFEIEAYEYQHTDDTVLN